MVRFIPREKLDKKARRQMDKQKRCTWTVPPVSKIFKSKKYYNRKQNPRDYQDDWNCGFFYVKFLSFATLFPQAAFVPGHSR